MKMVRLSNLIPVGSRYARCPIYLLGRCGCGFGVNSISLKDSHMLTEMMILFAHFADAT